MAQMESTADPNAFPTTFLDQCLMPVEDVFVTKIGNIVRKYSHCCSHELLKPLDDLLNWELDCLQGKYLFIRDKVRDMLIDKFISPISG